MKVTLSTKAEADLDEIEAYTVENFGVAQWLRYAGTLEQGLETLARFPMIGVASRQLPRGMLAYRCNRHWLCYEVRVDGI